MLNPSKSLEAERRLLTGSTCLLRDNNHVRLVLWTYLSGLCAYLQTRLSISGQCTPRSQQQRGWDNVGTVNALDCFRELNCLLWAYCRKRVDDPLRDMRRDEWRRKVDENAGAETTVRGKLNFGLSLPQNMIQYALWGTRDRDTLPTNNKPMWK